MNSQVKFLKKRLNINLEKWQEELNLEGRRGWKVIQVFQAPDGYFTALLRKDE